MKGNGKNPDQFVWVRRQNVFFSFWKKNLLKNYHWASTNIWEQNPSDDKFDICIRYAKKYVTVIWRVTLDYLIRANETYTQTRIFWLWLSALNAVLNVCLLRVMSQIRLKLCFFKVFTGWVWSSGSKSKFGVYLTTQF